ncbi:GNAT family N-acetyltransferase [Paenibacillus sp. J2TS4]|uniref:GNAT family N-acetyltransferase n=1 Tax=Paenibacillus sp. J2TS4 TaxID=2807194 RepID=UPI001B2B1020|nr:hypothetical protein J2TS4_19930 [Paenibacillus sp. J2TS4]
MTTVQLVKPIMKLEINKVLVVCDSNNIASKKVILKNGGIPDEDYIEEDGSVINRFWIEP